MKVGFLFIQFKLVTHGVAHVSSRNDVLPLKMVQAINKTFSTSLFSNKPVLCNTTAVRRNKFKSATFMETDIITSVKKCTRNKIILYYSAAPSHTALSCHVVD